MKDQDILVIDRIGTWLKEEFGKVKKYYLDKGDFYNLGYLHALLEINQFIRKEKEKIINE